MPTPISGLAALQLVSPAVSGQTLSIDTTVLPYIIDADPNTSHLEIKVYSSTALGSTTTANENPIFTGSKNRFTGTVPIDPTLSNIIVQIVGRNYTPENTTWVTLHNYPLGYRLVDPNGNVQLVTLSGSSGGSQPIWSVVTGNTTTDGSVTWKNLGAIAVTPTFKFNLLFFATSLALVIGPPSGVTPYKHQTNCRVEWVLPDFIGFLGVRVLLSTDPAGVNPPFTQFGDLVNNVTRSETSVISETESTQASVDPNTGSGVTVITTTQNTRTVNFSSVDIPFTAINTNQFYVMLSTVIQDPATNTVFESQQNGPITCGFVNLRLVKPTDFLALQRKEDIASRLIAQITRLYPDLDLTPRSEARDLMIDPFSLELANMSVREWFSRCSTSISAISQLDDSTGRGISDPFDSSPVKQQIARAYGLSASDTQKLIDQRFDFLGEQAGLVRGGALASVVTLTFYTFTKPTQSTTFSQGITCSTVADSEIPSLVFQTTGSATINSSTANSFFDPINGSWAVNLPAQCLSLGLNGNVGAGVIRNLTSGGPSGWNVTNLVAAQFGTDEESNSDFADRIAFRLVTGVDSGTRNGYTVAALSTPGIVSATVVAAGDVEMLRDWDPVRKKHVFGAVDIYVKGTSFDEQDDIVAFQYNNSGTFGQPATYIPLTLIDRNILKFQINNFNTLDFPPYTGVELLVSRSTGSFFFSLDTAQFDNTNGFLILNPNDVAYQYVGDAISKIRVPLILAGSSATNKTAVTYLSTQQGATTFQLFCRLQSPLAHIPTLQPVLSIFSVTGQAGQTETVPPASVNLIHMSDFLLQGGSNQAGDTVEASTSTSSPISKTITASTSSSVQIDTAMDVAIDSNGIPSNIVSVRSTDLSTLYTFGVDYTIVPTGKYHTYGLKILPNSSNLTSVNISSNILTVTAPNNFRVGAVVTFAGLTGATFLNNGSVVVATISSTQFTANFVHADYSTTPDSGVATTFNISNNQSVSVTYNKFDLFERLTLVTNEQQVLNGTLPTFLSNKGFIQNTWLPESYGNTTLSLDGAVLNTDGSINVPQSTGLIGALIPHDLRYIKIVFNGNVMREGIDFSLTVDPISGTAAITRILTGRIQDAGKITVSYFTSEIFTISTKFPSFVEQLASKISSTKHAAADVLVKAMIANPIDVTLTVTLSSNADASTLDPQIRTVIDIVLSNAKGTLFQSEVIRQVKAITGVANVAVPLTKCAKSDGAYDIGIVIPTQTPWIPLADDPAFTNFKVPTNAFISQAQVLPDTTIPSGGLPDAFVGLLFEGEPYRRASSIHDLLTNSAGVASFYIIGVNDQIDGATPLDFGYAQRVILASPNDNSGNIIQPGIRPYLVTYQVFNEGGAKDITMSSTEYFVPGRVTINYISG
jgi:hypothetical protein